MKRFASLLLVLVLVLSLVPAARAAEVVPSRQRFTLDGRAVTLSAYNIDGYNYVMLRGLAAVLSGTAKQFSVTWQGDTGTVSLETGKPYAGEEGAVLAVNGPAVRLDDQGRVTNAVPASQRLVVDGKAVTGVNAYNIGGRVFFKLADLKPWLGYGLDYAAAARTVVITTAPGGENPLTLTPAESYAAVRAGLEQAREQGVRAGGGGGVAVEESAEAEAPAPIPAPDAAPTENSQTAADQEKGYSDTNVQVEGIDEGDVVKTDGTYLYILREGRFLIARAAGTETKVLSDTEISYSRDEKDGWKSKDPFQLYVDGGRAVVLSQCYESGTEKEGWRGREYIAVDIYDVSDPARPKSTASLGQDGWQMGTRLMDGTLYLVTSYGVWSYDEEDPGTYVPALYRNGKAEPLPAGAVWLCPEPPSARYVVVAAYDLADGRTIDAQTVLGGGETLYMSRESLYVADSRYEETVSAPRTERGVYTVTDHTQELVTDLIRFDLTDGLTVAANGTVPGGLDDQFSLDEYQGYLRVVTTTGGSSYTVYEDKELGFVNYKSWETAEGTAGLYVLDPSLAVVGRVEDLAPGERVYSARFDGETAYFCTFRNIDPLFAVDLSVPTAPTVLSALKLTGFSDYLHPWADGLLFGAGYEADPDTGRTEGIKLVMFDTSDRGNVTVRTAKGTDLDYSEALNDHHAFLISPEKGLIAFPADDKYVVYGYDEAKGFTLRGTVDLDGWSWESRGLYIGQTLYVVGQQAIYVVDLDGVRLMKTVPLPTASDED